MRALVGITLWIVALNAWAGIATAPPPTQVEGCYRFDRPLGHSASGDLERSDSTWYLVELRENGIVVRPRLESRYWRDQYARMSSWRTSGDTLAVVVSTGLVGWDLALTGESDEYVGQARYITDALVIGADPLIVSIRGRREACQ